MNVLEISGVHKQFGGNKVLRGLDMTVPEHTVFGFVGQNGAGKTTTMHMVLGLLPIDRGEIRVCGRPVTYGRTPTNRHIGYLPDVPAFYGYMTAAQYLRLCGEIVRLPREETDRKSRELLELVGLSGAKQKIGGFSRGMKQRLGIAQALLGDPKLLICDEPTSALDPIGRREILTILQSVRGRTTVVFSTHVLSDVEGICDNVAVLHGGKLALCGPLAELKTRYRRSGYALEFDSGEEAVRFARAEALRLPAVSVQVEESRATVFLLDPDLTGSLLIDALSREGITPRQFAVLEPSLEHLFTEVVQ